MTKSATSHLRSAIDAAYLADETTVIAALADFASLSPADRQSITQQGAALVEHIRT